MSHFCKIILANPNCTWLMQFPPMISFWSHKNKSTSSGSYLESFWHFSEEFYFRPCKLVSLSTLQLNVGACELVGVEREFCIFPVHRICFVSEAQESFLIFVKPGYIHISEYTSAPSLICLWKLQKYEFFVCGMRRRRGLNHMTFLDKCVTVFLCNLYWSSQLW